MDWSLLDCGRSGHVTYAPAEADVRGQLRAQTETGEAWRCLRCGAYVAGEPQLSGPAAQAPAVRRGKELRSALILRIFAVERFLRALAVGAAAFVVWRFEYARETIEQAFNRERPALRALLHQLGYNIDNSKLVGLFNRALSLSPNTIKLVAVALVTYAVIEIIEGVGLWVAKRWGEYFAMVATSVGLPFEIYDLVSKVNITGAILFAINLTLVLYLVITKRLFGVRGGKRAYDARLRSESIMDAAIAAAAGQAVASASRGEADRATPPAEPARSRDAESPRSRDAEPPRSRDAEPPRSRDAESPRSRDAEPPRSRDAEPPRSRDADPARPDRTPPEPAQTRAKAARPD